MWKSPVCTSNPCCYWLEYCSSRSWQLLSAFASSLFVLFLWGSVKVCWQFLEVLSNPHWFLSFLLCLITSSLYTLVVLTVVTTTLYTLVLQFFVPILRHLQGIVLFLSTCWISGLPVLWTCTGLQIFPTHTKPMQRVFCFPDFLPWVFPVHF